MGCEVAQVKTEFGEQRSKQMDARPRVFQNHHPSQISNGCFVLAKKHFRILHFQMLRWLLDLERWVALPVGTPSFWSFTQRPWKGAFSF